MTNKRLLFIISDESEVEVALSFATSLKNKIKNIESHAVYVKDITKYEIVPTTINGLGMQNTSPLVTAEYQNIEDAFYEDIKERAKDKFDKIYSVVGDSVECVLEELKAYDALVVVKDNLLTNSMKSLLKEHYKPLIILDKQLREYNFDKILMLNDGGYEVNRSIFAYFNFFGEHNIDVLRVNVEDQNRLTERFGNICNVIDESGDVEKIILEYIKKYDLIVMGNLTYSLIFEKITGHIGLSIIEKSKNPLFIG